MILQLDSSTNGNATGHVDNEEISVEDFYVLISQRNDILLLDVRNDSESVSWKIESSFTPDTMYIPYTIYAEGGLYALPELLKLTAVAQDDRSVFVNYVLRQLPQTPEQYVEIKRVNIRLTKPDEEAASELELGKNICALPDASGLYRIDMTPRGIRH